MSILPILDRDILCMANCMPAILLRESELELKQVKPEVGDQERTKRGPHHQQAVLQPCHYTFVVPHHSFVNAYMHKSTFPLESSLDITIPQVKKKFRNSQI